MDSSGERDATINYRNKLNWDLGKIEILCHRNRTIKRNLFMFRDDSPKRKKRYFRCVLCKLNLSTKGTLRKHILSKHFKQKPYKCNICDQSFTFEKSFAAHVENHKIGKTYRCFCGQNFKRELSYKYHTKVYHTAPQQSFRCSFCAENFISRKHLSYHLQAKHPPKVIPCTYPSCEKVFSSTGLLRHHLETHSAVKNVCPICKKSFKAKYYLEKHKALHEGSRPYKCSDCDKAYISASHVNEHWTRTHSDIFKFLCSLCGKKFKKKFDVIFHENSHRKEKNYACGSCSFRANTKSSLLTHKRDHAKELKKDAQSLISCDSSEVFKKNIPHYVFSSGSEGALFKCINCDKCFKTAVRANEHWRRYHLVRVDFKCHLCSEVFENKETLKAHCFSHRGNKEVFKCDVCEYQTAFRIALHSHKKSHLKPAPKLDEENTLLSKTSSLASECNRTLKENRNVESHDHFSTITGVNKEQEPNEKCQSAKDEIATIHDISNLPNNENSCKISQTTKYKTKKLKRDAFSFATAPSTLLFGDASFYWDDEVCNQFSDGLPFDQTSLPDSNLSNLEEANSFNASEKLSEGCRFSSFSRTENVSKGFSDAILGYRRDPNLTLNCTAIDDTIGEFDDNIVSDNFLVGNN